jgi:hypothetical protein
MFILVQKNGKKGLLNDKLQEIIPTNYDEIKNYNITKDKNYLEIYQENKKGIVNWQGKILIDCQYDEIFYQENTKEKHAFVKKNKKWGVVDTLQNTWVSIEYDSIIYAKKGNNQFFEVNKNKKWGIIDKKNQILVPIKYNEIGEIPNDLSLPIAVKSREKWGFFDTNTKKEIVKPKYQAVKNAILMSNAQDQKIMIAIVQKGNDWGAIYLREKKQDLLPIIYQEVSYNFDEKSKEKPLKATNSQGSFWVDWNGNTDK